jgi:hypothetical protein
LYGKHSSPATIICIVLTTTVVTAHWVYGPNLQLFSGLRIAYRVYMTKLFSQACVIRIRQFFFYKSFNELVNFLFLGLFILAISRPRLGE